MEQCVALVDYDALAPDEISFRKGDIIHVTAKGSASGFWEGFVATPRHSPEEASLTGPRRTSAAPSRASAAAGARTGVFPNCFVSSNLRNLVSTSFQNKAVCLYSYTPADTTKAGAPAGPVEGGAASPTTTTAAAVGGARAEEMSFQRGDVLTVLRPSASPGWWYGINESCRQRMRARYLCAAQAPPNMKEGEGRSRVGHEGVRPERPLAASPVPDGSSAAAPPSQYLGSAACPPSSATHGGGPASLMLTAAQAELVDAASGSAERPLLFPSNFVSCDIAQAVFPFEARQAHELSCAVGDVILIRRRWNDGWWEGSLRGRRGIFPSNYTVPNLCTTRPRFFCQRCKTVYDDMATPNMALFLRADGAGASAGGGDGEASASPHLWRACSTCARAAEVTVSMLRALQAYTAGELAELDLFAFVKTDVGAAVGGEGDPAHAGGGAAGRAETAPSLLDARDMADFAVRRMGA